MSDLDCKEARFTRIPAVAFPIISIRWRASGAPATLHIGHPLTEERHVFPLRQGQWVYFREHGGIWSAEIGSVGEHAIEMGKFYWSADGYPQQCLPTGATDVRDGEMLRLSMLIATPSA